eukprot:Nitzschia sp. Nitz4//scaffold29_size155292//49708//50736//NITZ4_002649-RA/size155292-processed-gene-0.11-mRNA-1//1//CDS//3329546421//1448//frame0
MKSSLQRARPYQPAGRRLGATQRPDLSSLRRSYPPASRNDSIELGEETDVTRSDDEEEDDLAPNNKENEADKDADGSRKRPTDDEIAAEYSQKKKRQNRLAVLTEQDLLKPHGLSAIFQNFPENFRPHYSKTPRDMGHFAQTLIRAYHQWADAIQPGLPMDSTLAKVHSLGKKTVVRQHLQDMRNQVRDAHVERFLGLEKAQHLLEQLKDGLDMEQQMQEEDYPVDNLPANEPTPTTTLEEEGAESSSPSPKTPEESAPQMAPPTSSPAEASTRASSRSHVLEDSDDEEFEQTNTQTTATTTTTNHVTPTASSRRHVLEDSDDENELEFEEATQPNSENTED